MLFFQHSAGRVTKKTQKKTEPQWSCLAYPAKVLWSGEDTTPFRQKRIQGVLWLIFFLNFANRALASRRHFWGLIKFRCHDQVHRWMLLDAPRALPYLLTTQTPRVFLQFGHQLQSFHCPSTKTFMATQIVFTSSLCTSKFSSGLCSGQVATSRSNVTLKNLDDNNNTPEQRSRINQVN